MLIHWILYLLGGVIAGVVNAVAGGGTIVIFPLLLYFGLQPIGANTTSSFIVLPGSISSAFGYRHKIKKIPKYYFLLTIPCFIGSYFGAKLLVDTPNSSFERIVPFFMLIAVVLLYYQPKLHKAIYKGKKLKSHHILLLIAIAVAFLAVSAYGGFFGAGVGIIFLGLLGLTPIHDIQKMNGFKNLSAISVLSVDCVYFAAHHRVDWSILPLLMIGNLIGGYFGATYGSKLPHAKLRAVIIVVASIVTLFMFYKYCLKF